MEMVLGILLSVKHQGFRSSALKKLTHLTVYQHISYFFRTQRIIAVIKKISLKFVWPSRMQSTSSLPVSLRTIILPPTHNFF
jgi:lambda repressor-like predicted transcriptional regulator